MKKYLVTGGAGFIGSHFVDMLLRNSESIVVTLDKLTYAGSLTNLHDVLKSDRHKFVEGDICDRELVVGLFEEFDFNVVVNFAAESHVDRSIEDSAPFIKTNFTGVHVLLETAMEYWPDFKDRLFLQISTDEVYGALPDGVYADENHALRPGNPYSAAKASADLLGLSYFNTYGLPVIITRSCNNFGPRQYPEKLIPHMIKNMINGKKLPVYGDGLQVREWIYAGDHCRVLGKIIKAGKPGEIYNIGSGVSVSNIDLVRKLIRVYNGAAGLKLDETAIEYVADRKGHDRRYGLDCGKLHDLYANFNAGNFDDFIEYTIGWYLERYEKI